MSHSSKRSLNSWKKWYLSGAVQQPALPPGGLVIDAIGSHLCEPAAGFSTLSLCRPEDQNGKHSYSPVAYVIVPTSPRLSLGKTFERLPGNAMPLSLFFPETDDMVEASLVVVSEGSPIKSEAVTPRITFRHGIRGNKYTLIEKEGGWTQGEISLFVSGGVECEQLPVFPNRLVVTALVDGDEIETILGHNNFSARHVHYADRWR